MDLINDYTVGAFFLVTGVSLAALWLGWHDNRQRIQRLEELEDARWDVKVEGHPGEVRTRIEQEPPKPPRMPRWMRGED